MKTRIKYIIACAIAVLLTACLPKKYCEPVDYSENKMNHIYEILCESNNLCGKKRNIDWDKEGVLLKVGYSLLLFQIKEGDTIPLGIEDNRFYLFGGSLYGIEYTRPLLYTDYSTSNYVLRIALKDDINPEEREHIYKVLSGATQTNLMVKGAIRFYKSEEDPYFESKHDYVPELVISNINDIFIK